MRLSSCRYLLAVIVMMAGCSNHEDVSAEFSVTDVEATLRWLKQEIVPAETARQAEDDQRIQEALEQFAAKVNGVVRGQHISWSGFSVVMVEEEMVEVTPHESELLELAEFFFVPDEISDEAARIGHPAIQEDLIPFGAGMTAEQANELSRGDDVTITGEVVRIEPGIGDEQELIIGIFLKNASATKR